MLELVQPELPDEIIDPLTGESIPRDRPGALASALEDANDRAAKLRSYIRELKLAVAAMAPGEARTERVLFEGGALRVEHPSRSYDQRALKQAWAMPGAEELLRVERLAVNERAYKKVRDAVGEGPMFELREVIRQAEREPSSAPVVRVER